MTRRTTRKLSLAAAEPSLPLASGAVLLTGAGAVSLDDLAALRDFAGEGVPVHVGDVRGAVSGAVAT